MILRYNLLNNSKLYYIYKSKNEVYLALGCKINFLIAINFKKGLDLKQWGLYVGSFFMTGFFVSANGKIVFLRTPDTRQIKK